MDYSKVADLLNVAARGRRRLVVMRGAESHRLAAEWVGAATGFDLVLRADVEQYRAPEWGHCPNLRMLVGDLIHAVQPEAELPYGYGDRVRLFQALTSTARGLFYLANVSEPAQAVCGYAGDEGSMTLVSTSSPLPELSLDGAVFMDV